jgi:hypothetical protein
MIIPGMIPRKIPPPTDSAIRLAHLREHLRDGAPGRLPYIALGINVPQFQQQPLKHAEALFLR